MRSVYVLKRMPQSQSALRRLMRDGDEMEDMRHRLGGATDLDRCMIAGCALNAAVRRERAPRPHGWVFSDAIWELSNRMCEPARGNRINEYLRAARGNPQTFYQMIERLLFADMAIQDLQLDLLFDSSLSEQARLSNWLDLMGNNSLLWSAAK